MRRYFKALLIAIAVLLFLAGGTLWWGVRATFPEEPLLAGEFTEQQMQVGDRTRTWLEWVPESAASAAEGSSPALVLVFHGSRGNGAQVRKHYGYDWDRLAMEHGFIVLYPDGFEGHWNDCRREARYSARMENIDDIGFVRALVDRYATEHRVDRQRVYATGFSNGGHMCLRLAMEAPELVQAIAPVAASMPAPENSDCADGKAPMNVCFMNGVVDPMNPWDGGDVALYGFFGNRGPVLSTNASALEFIVRNQLPVKPEEFSYPDADTRDGSTVTRQRWSADGKKEVVLFTVNGGGHAVPHPGIHGYRFLGRWNRDISAAEEIWKFFESAP